MEHTVTVVAKSADLNSVDSSGRSKFGKLSSTIFLPPEYTCDD
jgi:hypothetical protein